MLPSSATSMRSCKDFPGNETDRRSATSVLLRVVPLGSSWAYLRRHPSSLWCTRTHVRERGRHDHAVIVTGLRLDDGRIVIWDGKAKTEN